MNMSKDERAAACKKRIEDMHVNNVCYTGDFSVESLPVKVEPDVEKEAIPAMKE